MFNNFHQKMNALCAGLEINTCQGVGQGCTINRTLIPITILASHSYMNMKQLLKQHCNVKLSLQKETPAAAASDAFTGQERVALIIVLCFVNAQKPVFWSAVQVGTVAESPECERLRRAGPEQNTGMVQPGVFKMNKHLNCHTATIIYRHSF